MFWPHKKSHSFIRNCCWVNLQVSHQGRKTCVKMEVKLIFRGAFRLLGTGIVECLEIIGVECNLKQLDGLTWLTLTAHMLRQIYATGGVKLAEADVRQAGRWALCVAQMCLVEEADDFVSQQTNERLRKHGLRHVLVLEVVIWLRDHFQQRWQQSCVLLTHTHWRYPSTVNPPYNDVSPWP